MPPVDAELGIGYHCLVLGRLLVDISLGVVAGLAHLVGDAVLGSRGPGTEARVVVLGNVYEEEMLVADCSK